MPEMRLLSDSRFRLPPIEKQDWKAVHAQAEGVDAELVLGLGRAVLLLEGVEETEVSPERLAWLQLVTLHINLLSEARSAYASGAGVTLQLLGRTAFEVILHTSAIVEPIASRGDRQHSVERLRAYTAWCFWQDLGLYNDLLNRQTLDGIWDPTLVQELADELAADPDKERLYEALLGPLKVEDPVELARERQRQASVQDDRRRLLAEWLRDSGLNLWRERLEASAQPGARHYRSFFALIGTGGSVADQLRKEDHKWMYPTYSRGSLYAHGTSADLYLHLDAEMVAPKLTMVPAAESGVATVAALGSSVMMLAALKKILWDD